MNNKGQVLVEFIIILPVLLLIVLAVIDFGNIISKKYELENNLDTVCDMYISNDNESLEKYLNDIKAEIKIDNTNEFTKITLEKTIKITSPLVNIIIGKKYKISVDKTIYNGE